MKYSWVLTPDGGSGSSRDSPDNLHVGCTHIRTGAGDEGGRQGDGTAASFEEIIRKDIVPCARYVGSLGSSGLSQAGVRTVRWFVAADTAKAVLAFKRFVTSLIQCHQRTLCLCSRISDV